MNTLQDLAVSLEREEPMTDGVFLTEENPNNDGSSIRSSANAYQDINRQLGSFYETRPEEMIRKRWNWNGVFRSWSVRRRKSARRGKTARNNFG